jgi:hypothetical protein
MPDETRPHPVRPEVLPADRSKSRDRSQAEKEKGNAIERVERKIREAQKGVLLPENVEDDVSPAYGPLH